MKKNASNSPRNATTSILRGLGKGPKAQPAANRFIDDADFHTEHGTCSGADYRSGSVRRISHDAAPDVVRFHPDTVRDLANAIAASLQFHPHTVRELAKAVALQLEVLPNTIGKLALAIYGHLEKNMAALVEQHATQASGKVECSVCADGDHRHVHPFDDMTTKDVCAFMGWKPSAVYGRTKHRRMPPPISAVTPHMYDPHCISLLKEHGLVFPHPRYDRNTHLALLPKVEAERANKKAAFHKKQSARMRRDNASRASMRADLPPGKKPSTKTAGTRKSTVRRETSGRKR